MEARFTLNSPPVVSLNVSLGFRVQGSGRQFVLASAPGAEVRVQGPGIFGLGLNLKLQSLAVLIFSLLKGPCVVYCIDFFYFPSKVKGPYILFGFVWLRFRAVVVRFMLFGLRVEKIIYRDPGCVAFGGPRLLVSMPTYG